MPRRSTVKLVKSLREAKERVKVGGQYEHYKTKGRYIIENIAFQEATEEICIVYRSLSSPQLLWVRDMKNWLEEIEGSNGRKIPRFMLVSND